MPTDVTGVLESAAPDQFEETVGKIVTTMTWSKALYTVLLFLACVAVIKVVLTLVDRAMGRLHVEPTVRKFTRSSLKVLLWLVTVMIVAGYIGIEVNSLVAVLGIVGVALSLSLQGALSNLAGGIMVLLSKPFSVGDYVEAGGMSGTVQEIGLVYTKLQTIDNKVIYMPNGEISSEKIVNYNAQTQRRVDLKFDISYDDDPEVAKAAILEVVGAHPKALFTPAPFARVSSYNDSSVSVTLRVWCATEDYWDLYFDLLEQVRAAFDAKGVQLTYNHLNVHLKQEKGE